MNYIKKLYVPTIGAVLSAIIFYVENSNGTFGLLANHFFPCTQNPMNSFPCYGVFDIWVMVVALIFFIVSVIFALVRFVKIVKNR